MTWLVWRQHRKQALGTMVGLLALAAVLIPSGMAMHHAYTSRGLDDCFAAFGHAQMSAPGSEACITAFNRFSLEYRPWGLLGILLLVVPMVIGLFWGAPLVARELDQGTHRLVWTQGVSRRRWALVKFSLVGVFVLMVALPYGFGVSWWVYPLNHVGDSNRFQTLFFDMQGLAPAAYTLFAVALGIYAGTIWHRVLPAMAVTLGGFVAVRVIVTAFIRPHYAPAKTLAFPVQGVSSAPNPAAGDWVLHYGIRDASGQMMISNAEVGCAADATGPGANSCAQGLGGVGPGSYNWRLYQPGDRFWMFQAMETGLFLGLTVVLLLLAVRQIRRTA